jgi:hypothetical protein
LQLCDRLLALAAGPHAETVPETYYGNLGRLLLEALDLKDVEAGCLSAVTAKRVYGGLTETFPLPKIKAKLPDLGWRKIWGRLALASLPAVAVDVC